MDTDVTFQSAKLQKGMYLTINLQNGNEITFIRGQIRVQTWNDSSSVCAREKYTFKNEDSRSSLLYAHLCCRYIVSV